MTPPDALTPGWSVQVQKDGVAYSTVPLTVEKSFIGRMSQNHIMLDHPSVSRSHASITQKLGKFFIHDQGSQNGTLLNGRVIFQDEFKPGDVISIGPFTLKLVPQVQTKPLPQTKPADESDWTLSGSGAAKKK